MKNTSIAIILMCFLNISCGKGNRVGAICNDGWKSSSTGSGTCSNHGGVDYWIYKKGSEK